MTDQTSQSPDPDRLTLKRAMGDAGIDHDFATDDHMAFMTIHSLLLLILRELRMAREKREKNIKTVRYSHNII